MKYALPLPEDKKLSVTYRVEAGCLGPDGVDHILDFCHVAQSVLNTLESDYIALQIVYREDKLLPEMEYHLNTKSVTYDQAEKYLALIGKSLEEFEGHLGDQITTLINKFMGHKL
jgi:translation initiation factor 2 alpha subunit (eIF-2alpha)